MSRAPLANLDLEMSLPSSRLREDDINNKPNSKPTSGPEIDDLYPNPGSGIDDGLLPENPNTGIDDGLLPEPEYPNRRRPPVGGRDFPQPDDGIPGVIPVLPPHKGVDLNVYQHKKTLAQGMMDIALLSANANQLRYVLESDGKHPYYYPGIVLISLSLILQIAVGIGLILNSRYNVKHQRDVFKADRLNNMTVLGVFLITITNVFISAFGVASTRSTDGPVLAYIKDNATRNMIL